MSFFRNMYTKLRDKVFGAATNPVQDSAPMLKRRGSRFNQGPADPRYLKRLFPRGIFTKTLTPCRVEQIKAVMRTLRPDQKTIVRAKGWTRGLDL